MIYKLLIYIFLSTIGLGLLYSSISFDGVSDKILFYYKIFSRILLLCFTYLFLLVYKNKIKFNIKNHQKYIFYGTLILLGLTFSEVFSYEFNYIDGVGLIFFFSCLSVGFCEEFLFRNLIFNLFRTQYQKSILASSIITTTFFALFHFSNFITGKFDIFSTLIQIELAFIIGFFLQSVYLKFNNLILISFIHAAINYFGSYQSNVVDRIDSNINQIPILKELINDFLNSQIFIILLFILIFLPCFFYVRKITKTEKIELKHNFVLK